VQEAVTKLGYVPHGAARALASKRSRTIGAVIPTLDNPIFASSIQAMQKRLAEDGCTLLLGSHEYDLEAGVPLARQGRASLRAHLDARRRRVPPLPRLLEPRGSCAGGPAPDRPGPSTLRHGVGPHRDQRSRREALGRVLAEDPSVTAIVCGNDILAIGVLIEAAARGIRVPEAMSVTGFDDIDLAREWTPALTTVRLPVSEIGQRAAERMLGRLDEETPPRIEEVHVELVERASSGPAP
jgi:LacI family transcriptional regulator